MRRENSDLQVQGFAHIFRAQARQHVLKTPEKLKITFLLAINSM